LRSALIATRSEGIDGRIYSHPLGRHGHGAGPAIGQWDKQGGVPGTGRLPVDANTCSSIELAAFVPKPGWPGDRVAIMLEENAFFDGTRVDWLDGRQTELLLIGP
jgi:hypothetical protein